jgi:hypothetical protein
MQGMKGMKEAMGRVLSSFPFQLLHPLSHLPKKTWAQTVFQAHEVGCENG